MPDPQDNGAPGIEMRSQQHAPPPATCSAASGTRGRCLVREVPASRRPADVSEGSARLGRRAAARGRATSPSARPRRWLSRCARGSAPRRRLPGMVRTGATFADAAAEYLRWLEHDRERKPSTLRDYQLDHAGAPPPGLRRAGASRTSRPRSVERFGVASRASGRMNNRTRLEDPHCAPRRHAARASGSGSCRATRSRDVEKPTQRRSGRASPSSRPRRSMRPGASRGLRAGRGDLPDRGLHRAAPRRARRAALARRRLRRAGTSGSRPATPSGPPHPPKSGKVRSVPMAPLVAEALARLGSGRERWTGDDDLVFPGDAGGYLDALGAATAATRPRSSAAGLRTCAFTTCATRSARR